MPDNEDKKVKDLLDATTRAELERWFGLPSFEQLAEEGKQVAPPPPEDPQDVARSAAIAAVDPVLLEALYRRAEPPPYLIKFKAVLEVQIDPDIVLFDHAMIERPLATSEPREYSLPEDLEDDLKERVPQALLRDLHRPEIDFDKVFEAVDTVQRVDHAEIIADTMVYKRPPVFESKFREARAALAEHRDELRKPWAEAAKLDMPNRRVTE